VKISELNDEQRAHLAWRLDHKTYVGFITAGRIVRGEFGDDEVREIFKRAGKSERSAAYHAGQVERFKIGERSYYG
jgi:hypothetical protein